MLSETVQKWTKTSIDELRCLHFCRMENDARAYWKVKKFSYHASEHRTTSKRNKWHYIAKLFVFLNFKMATSCCVVNCRIGILKDSKLPFYRIPSNKTAIGARRRREWLKAINRSDWDTWTPERISKERVYGSHFLSGG